MRYRAVTLLVCLGVISSMFFADSAQSISLIKIDLIRDVKKIQGAHWLVPIAEAINPRFMGPFFGGTQLYLESRCRYFAKIETLKHYSLPQIIGMPGDSVAAAIYNPRDCSVVVGDTLPPWIDISFNKKKTVAVLHLSQAAYSECPCLKELGINPPNGK